ncbi:hypothetical protein H8356DRAFT_1435765 [Neocallimastix lanati (nom. inval.)]|nr:hypothetical protein H8356DRAFT_1435765 [Neocallimastix sp. JGI-2020a]
MPFGISNASATFQSFINSILRPYLGKSFYLKSEEVVLDPEFNHCGGLSGCGTFGQFF